MSEKKSLFDLMCEPDFPVDAMEDYEDRMKSGEFEDLTDEEIREIYKREALDAEEAEGLLELQAMHPEGS